MSDKICALPSCPCSFEPVRRGKGQRFCSPACRNLYHNMLETGLLMLARKFPVLETRAIMACSGGTLPRRIDLFF